ncbi:MAG: hydrogen gas-evolving membrane-bound hydrogenase subunit E [Acidimicrobiales bacterium]|nr:DUF4040 domain-containing protein [Acidimicrobiales bacterium]
MILWLLGLHLVGVVIAGLAGTRSLRTGLVAASIAPAITAVWAGMQLAGDGEVTTSEITWVEGLDLTFRFATGPLASLMALLVSGIGALVFVYATGYFGATERNGRFPASLLAFSASMLGLVLADSIWTLFIFWEFTSVTSFLLVGHKDTYSDVLAAARRALLITGAGGLSLLAGLLIVARETGTSVLSEMGTVSGAAGATAAVLVMVAAATKSAQFPFHVWLPGAMAAPTPVSAYLHSATMVKAGVLLVALAGPIFSAVRVWDDLGLVFGGISMMWGAIGALRQTDAKLILAWGTVSQLGFMIALLSAGTAKATFAALAVVTAHALFKAALFLVVGEVDIRAGTREISELGGLWRKMPIAFAVAVVAAMSMAGAPPLLGFMAKEAAVEAVLVMEGTRAVIVGAIVFVGSVLTVAYTLRFLIGTFGGDADTAVKPRRWTMTIPAVTLGAAGLAGFVVVSVPDALVRDAATLLDDGSSKYHLIRWPGLTTGLVISLAILAVGSALGAALSRRSVTAPRPLGAATADMLFDSVLKVARFVTARVQHGSLPVYIITMTACAALAAVPFATDFDTQHLVVWDTPIQGFIALAVIGAAVGGAFVDSRLGAALTLGAVGIGVSGLFVVHGAPDLFLTQLLVETVVVVGFVVGLGHLARRFPPAGLAWRGVRIAVASTFAVAVMVALASAGSKPTGTAPIEALTDQAVAEGGGNNVVNVILTDMRALDTLGEVVVLATVAIGILALSRLGGSRPEHDHGGRAT